MFSTSNLSSSPRQIMPNGEIVSRSSKSRGLHKNRRLPKSANRHLSSATPLTSAPSPLPLTTSNSNSNSYQLNSQLFDSNSNSSPLSYPTPASPAKYPSASSLNENSTYTLPQLTALPNPKSISNPSPILSNNSSSIPGPFSPQAHHHAHNHLTPMKNNLNSGATALAPTGNSSNSFKRNNRFGHRETSNSATTSTIIFNNNPIVTEGSHLSGVTSIRGLKPGNPNWINQDNYLVWENIENNGEINNPLCNKENQLRIYGVFDGHGENGHYVSRKCKDFFPISIINSNFNMDDAFFSVHNELSRGEFDVKCSGATCVVALVTSSHVFIYNCGDSRAVLGKKNNTYSTLSGSQNLNHTKNASNSINIMPFQLSNDHKPDNPEERKRILSCGGHLGCRQVMVNQGRGGAGGPISVPMGPCRVWYQHRGETLGLAMSRSLGDVLVHQFGVTHEPELTEHKINKDEDLFIILATDGVWDVIDNFQAVQIVYSFVSRNPNDWNPSEASSNLTKFARSRWEKASPMIDDITCIVVKLT